MRNRRLESFLNTSSGQRVEETPKVSVKEVEPERRLKSDIFSSYSDEGLLLDIISWIRIIICFVSMMVTTFIWALIMLVLIPWPYERIRQGNIYGHVTGRMLVSYFWMLTLEENFMSHMFLSGLRAIIGCYFEENLGKLCLSALLFIWKVTHIWNIIIILTMH